MAEDDAYPSVLKEREVRLIENRRKAAGLPSDVPSDALGFGISGGGIRSATFALGFFQSLASGRLVRFVDYMSTVSGGGYFGSFLGRLFRRGPDVVSDVDEVEDILAGHTKERIVGSLRSGEKYMAPNGAGDLILAGAVFLRNLISVHVVLALFFLTIFLVGQLGERLLAQAIGGETNAPWICALPVQPTWASPFLALAAIVLVGVAIPLGWAYWLIEPPKFAGGPKGTSDKVGQTSSLLAVGLTLLIPLVVYVVDRFTTGRSALFEHRAIFMVLSAIAGLSIVAALLARFCARSDESEGNTSATRRLLSEWLARALMWATVLVGLGLVDSIAGTLYMSVSDMGVGRAWGNWLAGAGTALIGAFAFGKKIVIIFNGEPTAKRPKISIAVIAIIGAALLSVAYLVVVATASHAICWNFSAPREPSAQLARGADEPLAKSVLLTDTHPDGVRVELSIKGTPATEEPKSRAFRDLDATLLPTGVSLLFTVLFGLTCTFLNRSSYHAHYSMRLTRAHLGASNPKRWRDGLALTKVAANDDIGLDRYFELLPDENMANSKKSPALQKPSEHPVARAAPLHFINVTINETVDGQSEVQQQDRRGIGMAIGPCGFSAGIRHHSVFRWPVQSEKWEVVPPVEKDKNGRWKELAGHSVFRPDAPFEKLTIGSWAGVSGAAFSTGIGSRTSLGLSLLCGMANVRLGYWWNSGVPRWTRGLLGTLLRVVFPVQTHLLSEFVARFPGTAWTRWYLSDGGHFENLGGYELIRRRLKRIVLVDAEADASYQFEGLGNLVRKARLDFGAEITFLSETQLDRKVDPSYRRFFGTLDQLRRGTWERKETAGGVGMALTDERVDGLSLAYAALAEVRYSSAAESVNAGGGPLQTPDEPGLLLYVKPALRGVEPVDVLRFHREHPAFPHDPTADQFFDEAQWESYRRLGQFLGDCLFRPPPVPDEIGESWRRRPGVDPATSVWTPGSWLTSAAPQEGG